MNLGGSIRINKCGVLLLSLLVIFIFYFISTDRTDPSRSYGFTKNQNEINLRKLLIGSIQAAQKGGLEVVAVSKLLDQHVQSKGKTKEGANDPVTQADKLSHCVMKQGLARIFPKVRIVSEEDRAECVDTKYFDLDPTVLHENVLVPDENVAISDVTFWIDPLDATQEYTEKLYQYVTTMVCVAVKGKPVIGVIHNPFTSKTVWAWVGKAMSEDLSKIKKDDDTIKHPVIIVSRSHPGAAGDMAKLLFGGNAKTIVAAGAGYKVLQVVFNNATAYVHTTNIKKWDICAGDAILRALHGRLSDLKNNEIDYGVNEENLNDVVNDKGLLATMANHDVYLRQLKANENHNSDGNNKGSDA